MIRDDLIAIATETIAAVNPATLLQETCRLVSGVLHVGQSESKTVSYDLSAYAPLFLCAIGKAAEPMARYFLETLAIEVSDGIVITKEREGERVGTIPVRVGGHPLPTEQSVQNGAALTALAARAGRGALMIQCISGGASALCCAPWQDETIAITLDDYRVLTQLLLDNALPIEKINCIRSQVSQIKGGKYLRHIWPAQSLSFILSDVRYDNLQIIASGLTEPASHNRADAVSILRDYALWKRVPERIRMLLSTPETVSGTKLNGGRRKGDAHWQHQPHAINRNVIIGNTYRALTAAKRSATAYGYTTMIVTDCLFGEASAAAAHIAAVCAFHLRYTPMAARGFCLLFGGETTVTVRGSGKGGRNQELTTAFLKIVTEDLLLGAAIDRIGMISFSTDGNDGPTDAAGGVCDALTVQLLAQGDGISIDAALARNDSYHLLQQVNGLYKSGYSATNVCDVQCVLIRAR